MLRNKTNPAEVSSDSEGEDQEIQKMPLKSYLRLNRKKNIRKSLESWKSRLSKQIFTKFKTSKEKGNISKDNMS